MYATCSYCRKIRYLNHTEGNWFSCGICGDSRHFSNELKDRLQKETAELEASIDKMPQTD